MVVNMGAKRSKMSFIKGLLQGCIDLRRLKPNQIYVFNVIADHGSYQIIVGPEYSPEQCKKLELKPRSRKIEINGIVHNLFVNPRHISPNPKEEDLRYNLKGSVIMKQMMIHIVDSDGCGTSVKIKSEHRSGFRVGQTINLAGARGEEMLNKYMKNGRLLRETYKIIQSDILEALKALK